MAVASSPAPVGSGVFVSGALFVICLLVLILLRRYLTLRATPAYIVVPVFLSLVLPASVVLLVPIDLASSSRAGGAPKGIWLPDRAVLVLWRIAYWLIFVLTWFVSACVVSPVFFLVACSMLRNVNLTGLFCHSWVNSSIRDIGNPKTASYTRCAPMPAII